MHDLHDLLARGDGLRNRLPFGLLLHRLHKVPRHGQGNVGFQQRHADLAQGGCHVRLGKRTLLGELIKDAA